MQTQQELRRGDIWIVNLPESNGSIQTKQRPAVLVSNNLCNHYSTVQHICPLTSITTKSKLPTHIMIKNCGLLRDSIALCEQSMPITRDSFIAKIGVCDEETMMRISQGISIQFGLAQLENKCGAVNA